ncbi:epimerase [Kitasatospora sp. NPDC048540]|uniref:epimerase n=1 Tax=unclassified Kitasatospora TaxID=2633591 RepID=UPI000A65D990|nr:epimerase [Kitasatospora sp. MBT63]
MSGLQVVVFGASGMVGQGVLRECLLDDRVAGVLAVVRSPLGRSHPKLTEAALADFTDLAPLGDRLAGLDACFYCLGVSSVGMDERAYTRVSYDYPLAAARVLLARNPGLTFTYVTGEGTDRTGRSRAMWARVKGRAENDLIALGPDTYMFRPGFIQPRHGARSRTGWYRAGYAVTAPLFPVLRRLVPGWVTATDTVGRAMLAVAVHGDTERVLSTRGINRLGGQ